MSGFIHPNIAAKEGINMELWYTEKQTDSFGITAKVKETYVREQTEFQDLSMIETEEWGTMLTLDGMVMTTVRDEFVYHEMVAHPALVTHPNPENVLVVGGGDGGVIREIMKHPKVKKAVLVDIDGKVIEYSKKYLPTIAGELDNPRVEVIVNDGYMHIHDHKNTYDVIMVDSTEPVGPAVELFSKGFYQGIYDALKEDGIFVAQTDNPWFKADLIQTVNRDVKEISQSYGYTARTFLRTQAVSGPSQWAAKSMIPCKLRKRQSRNSQRSTIHHAYIERLLYCLNLLKI